MALPEISIALTSLKTAVNLVKTIHGMNKDPALNEKVIELQNAILSLQNSMLEMHVQYSDIIIKNQSLEEKLVEYESWEKTKDQYKLLEIAPGVFVYSFFDDKKTDTPFHWICPKCFEDRVKSILQQTRRATSGYFYQCPNCKTEFRDHSKSQPKRYKKDWK